MAKKKRRVIRPWSSDDVKRLRSLAKARMSGPKIAKTLGRTAGAVAQKAMKLGVRFRSIERRA
jgi:biotin operon repressor